MGEIIYWKEIDEWEKISKTSKPRLVKRLVWICKDERVKHIFFNVAMSEPFIPDIYFHFVFNDGKIFGTQIKPTTNDKGIINYNEIDFQRNDYAEQAEQYLKQLK